MPVSSSLVATYAGKEFFKALILNIYNALKIATSNRIKVWNTESKIKELYSAITRIQYVKTLWQVDKAIKIETFYVPPYVEINKERKRIDCIRNFETSANLLIEGIAGQGKSIFIRYLCTTELAQNGYLPIFAELRKIKPNQSMKMFLFESIDALGLPMDDIVWDALIRTKKLIFLLDGFDEVADDLKINVINDIESLITANEDIRIIVTSRPNSGLDMSAQFHVVKLSNLKGDEYKSVINKLAPDEQYAYQLFQQIEQHPGKMSQLLITPLMVTLLVVCYKSFQEIPSQLSDFYSSLFQVLLSRHDGTKPAYRRKRSCQLNDTEYRYLFEIFCFLSKMTTKPIHTEQQVYDYSKQAIKELQLKVDPECFLNDIVKITCLVLKDVDQYRFIHKTVQEYFAASMVHRKPESWAKDFYFKMVDGGCRGFWNQELAFLNEIDKFRYNKYFLIPSLCKLIGVAKEHLKDVKINITGDIIKEKLSDEVELGLRIEHGKGHVCRITLPKSMWPYNDKFTSRLFRINYTPVVSAIFANKIRYRTAEREAYINDGSGRAKVYSVKLQDILNSGYLLSEITDLLTDIFTLAKKTAIAANEFVEKEEIDRSLLDAVIL